MGLILGPHWIEREPESHPDHFIDPARGKSAAGIVLNEVDIKQFRGSRYGYACGSYGCLARRSRELGLRG
jgi:hypothetical protein